MLPRPDFRGALTPGERLRRAAYVVTAMTGALLALAVAVRLGQGAHADWTLTRYDLWVIVTGLAGGLVGLRLTEDRFGHPGPRGLLRALGGVLLICITAPVVAGSLALPLYGTMFGPFMLGTTIAALPILGLLWVATLMSVHLCLAPWRRERDSVFADPGFRSRRGSSGSP